MEMTNFTSPLETAQIISMFTYLTVLSDFLFKRKFLNASNIHQPIPVVNALYDYCFEDYQISSKIMKERKISLVRELIKDSDLYGSQEYETPDEVFINAILKHIITSLVFNKYTNIYGFLAKIIIRSNNLKISTFRETIMSELLEEKFSNDYGPDSTLHPLSVYNILSDFIFPLFPTPTGNLSLISVDYIYAQAGAIFFLSSDTAPIMESTLIKNKDIDPVLKFNTYVATAHAVEQAAVAGQIDKSALRIFALPALLYYVHSEKKNLKSNIANIIYNSTYGTEAYERLFAYLSKSFIEVEKVQANDYRYQFYLAISNFKNRTTLAKDTIRVESYSDDGNIEQEVTDFKNHPNNYRYKVGNRSQLLPDLNLIYQNEVNYVTKMFFIYEKESIREAFGDLAKPLEKTVITSGLIRHYYFGSIGLNTMEVQLIKDSDNIFRVYFPETKRVVYYALIRRDNNVSLIQEFGNSEAFREKLGLSRYETFREHFFPNTKKLANESFEVFITRVAEERTKKFNKSLNLQGYDQTTAEWWKEFGLSLVPFYQCKKYILEKNFDEANFACSLDVISLIPLFGEVGSIFTKFTSVATRSVLSFAGTTLGSVSLRMLLREMISISGKVLVHELSHLQPIMIEASKDLGAALFRFLDPGVELVFTLGKWGLRSIGELMRVLEKYPVSLKTVNSMLEKSERVVSILPKKVGRTVLDREMFVKSGYGFKFVHLPGNKIAQVRKVREYGKEIPVVFERASTDNRIIYKAVNPVTGETKNKNLHLVLNDLDFGDEFHLQNSLENSELPSIRIKSFHDSQNCKSDRSKRWVKQLQCLRNFLRHQRSLAERTPINYAKEVAGLQEGVVRDKLRKYVFPENSGMQLRFVKEWTGLIKQGKQELPAWCTKFEIKDPELFNRLRYADSLDKSAIPKSEAVARIKANYALNGEQYTPVENSAVSQSHFFELENAHESVSYEDFFALRNYMGDGYKKIWENTVEATRMKEALYRLAIRQSDDPAEEFDRVLFRGETRDPEVIRSLFTENKEIVFNRFTSTSSKKSIAGKFQVHRDYSKVKVLYEMKFSGPYFRAKVQNVIRDINEAESVLLPGSKFRVDNVDFQTKWDELYMKVKMSYLHDTPKHEWYKRIMDELDKLKNNKAPLYEVDPPPNPKPEKNSLIPLPGYFD